jgi:hypothetical protein
MQRLAEGERSPAPLTTRCCRLPVRCDDGLDLVVGCVPLVSAAPLPLMLTATSANYSLRARLYLRLKAWLDAMLAFGRLVSAVPLPPMLTSSAAYFSSEPDSTCASKLGLTLSSLVFP